MKLERKLLCGALGVALAIQFILFFAAHRGTVGVPAPQGAKPRASSSAVQIARDASAASTFAANDRSSSKSLAGVSTADWEVITSSSGGHLLLSEALAAQSPQMHAQRFRVINKGASDLRFTVRSPSCGCLGFEKDGASLAIGNKWGVSARSEEVIVAKFPLSPRPGSIERGFDLAEMRDGQVAAKRRLVWRVELHDDLTVDPPVLNCAHRAGVLAPANLTLSIAVCTSNDGADVAPELQLPNDAWLRLCSMTRDSAIEDLGGRLRSQRFRAALKVDERRLREMVAAGSATCEALARVILPSASGARDDRQGPSVTVPIAIRDAAILDAPPLIHFGTVRVGATVKRSVLVASRDGGDFSLREASTTGAEGIAAKLPERKSRYQVISVSFTPEAAGDQSGKLTLIPATREYRATTIGYHAIVAAAEADKPQPEAKELQR